MPHHLVDATAEEIRRVCSKKRIERNFAAEIENVNAHKLIAVSIVPPEDARPRRQRLSSARLAAENCHSAGDTVAQLRSCQKGSLQSAKIRKKITSFAAAYMISAGCDTRRAPSAC